MMFFEHIQNARESLRTTRSRTLLTITGVAIGVASITAILSLATGIQNIIAGQVKALEGNVAVVRPSAKTTGINDLANPTPFQAFATSTLTERDLTTITELPNIDGAAPLMMINGSLKSDRHTIDTAPIIATSPSLEKIAKLELGDGEFVTTSIASDTVVLGNQLSIDLFGTNRTLGRSVIIRGQPFHVAGILAKQNDPINFNNVDFDNSALITLERGKAFNQGIAQIQQINIRADSHASLPKVTQAAAAALDRNHAGEKDYQILTGSEIAQPTSRLYNAIAGVTAAIAGISLIVGGIGIMNIMLVGVAERTREIGIRKAVGASDRNIVFQFLVEALILSLMGGVIGYAAGLAGAFLISTFLTFDPAFSWQILLLAVIVSLGVGIAFGLYPAIRASRKDPIESLRQYH